MAGSPETSVTPAAGEAARADALLMEALDGCRRHLTVRALVRRLVLVGALAALAPLLVVIGDHHWPGGLPRPVLGGLLLAWVAGIIVALAGATWTVRWRRLSLLFVGWYLERTSGIRHNSVINALLLRGAGRAPYAEDAAVQQAARDVTAHRLGEGAAADRGRLPQIALLGAGAAWLLYLFGAAKPIGPSLARFFGADVMAPTATWLELAQPRTEDVVHAGEPLEIEVAVHGRQVSDVRFETREPGGAAGATVRTYALSEPRGAQPVRRRLVLAPFEVRADIHYRCTAGDARLEGVIPVQPQPDVVGTEIVLEPPAYTGWPRATVTTPDLDVLAGTQATFCLQANTAIADPVFVFWGERETRTRMTVATETPRLATLTLRLTQTGMFRVEFSDRWGYACRASPQHRIDVRADRPPSVQIVLPAEGQTPADVLDVRQFPEIAAVAEDDVSVADLAFLVQQGDGLTCSPVTVTGPTGGPRVTGYVPTVGLPLEAGRTVRVWFEVTDGRVLLDGRPAPQTAKSRVLTLTRSAAPPVVKEPPAVGETPLTESSDGGQREPGVAEPESPDGAEAESLPPREEPRVGGASEPGSAATQPTSQRGDREEGENASAHHPTGAAANGSAAGEAPEAADGNTPGGERSSEDEFGRELEGFVKKHGEQARSAARAARRSAEAETKPAPEEAPVGEGQPCQGGEDQDGGGHPGGPARPASPDSQPGTQDQPKSGASSAGASGEGLDASPSERSAEEPDGDQGSGEAGAAASHPASGSRNSGQAGQRTSGWPGSQSGEQGGGADGQRAEDERGPPPGGDGENAGAASSQPAGERGEPGARAGTVPGGGGGLGGGEAVPASRPAGVERAEAPDDGVSAHESESPESTGLVETLHLLEMLERGQGVSEGMLVEAGWPVQEAAAFVQALRRLHETAKESGNLGAFRRLLFDTRVGNQERQTGRGVAAGVKRGLDSGTARHDGLGRIAPPAEQSVPENLEALLDAYYRSLAAQRAREQP